MFMLLRGQRPVHPKYSSAELSNLRSLAGGIGSGEKNLFHCRPPGDPYDVHAIRDISFIALFSRAALRHIYIRIHNIYIYTCVDNNNRIDI